MANISGSNFKRWDTVTGASFSEANTPRNPRVKQIRIEAPTTGGTVTLTVGGATWFTGVIPGGSFFDWSFGDGVYLSGLTATALGSDCIVTVTYA